MKKLLIITLCVFSCSCVFAQNKDETAIKKMLKAQEDAWNRGNMDDFMKGYWENDSMMFIGAKGPRYGYNVTLESYKKSYADTAHMGKFTSTLMSMKRLSPEYYFIVGKWELKRSVGDVSGYYTLLLRKVDGQWVIVCDHSS